jgi:hypothetical protein
MSGCQEIIYSKVPQDVFTCMKKKLEAEGIHVPEGNIGEMEGSGIKAHFEWDGISNLKIIITDKPFVLICGYVIGKITDFVHECNGN